MFTVSFRKDLGDGVLRFEECIAWRNMGWIGVFAYACMDLLGGLCIFYEACVHRRS
jgi:hypothetical protein